MIILAFTAAVEYPRIFDRGAYPTFHILVPITLIGGTAQPVIAFLLNGFLTVIYFECRGMDALCVA